MFRRISLYLIFFVFIYKFSFAILVENNYQRDFSKNIKINFHSEEDTYYLGEPFYFEFSIHNLLTAENFRFQLFENVFIQFNLIVKKNNQIRVTKSINLEAFEFNLEQKNLNQVGKKKNKTIELAFKESFSGRINLNDFYDFSQTGDYYVEGIFYPLGNLAEEKKNYYLKVEPFVFTIKGARFNALNEYPAKENSPEKKKFSNSKRNDLNNSNSPQDLIKNHINGIRFKNWDQFLNTLEFKELLLNNYNNTTYFERFQSAYNDEKFYIIENFKDFLVDNITYEIDEYKVLKTIVDRDEKAQIEVYFSLREAFENLKPTINEITGQEEKRWVKEDDKQFVKNYVFTYQLKNKNNNWKITSIDVQLVNGLPEEEIKSLLIKKGSPSFDEATLLGNILFEVNSDIIPEESYEFLDSLTLYLKENPALHLKLSGHTDNTGEKNFNYDLSERRSLAVYYYLIDNGIAKEKIFYSYSGFDKPLNLNRNSREKQINRRVEVSLFY